MVSDLDILSSSISDGDSWRMRTELDDDLVKIVCIADTHNGHGVRRFREKIEGMDGDILIHAGDLSEHGTLEEVQSAFEWLYSLENFTHTKSSSLEIWMARWGRIFRRCRALATMSPIWRTVRAKCAV